MKFRVIYSSVSYYPVDVEIPDNADKFDAIREASKVIADAEAGLNTDAVNEMYDKHDCSSAFKFEKVAELNDNDAEDEDYEDDEGGQ